MIKNKHHLIIFTTMPSNFWGGSEELWSLLAKEMCLKGEKITILAYHNESIHPNFLDLSHLGIEIQYIRNKEKNNIVQKIYNKILRWKSGYSNTPHNFYVILTKLKKINPSHFLINQGGTFNFIEDQLFLFLMNELPLNYMLISQHNLENFTFSYDYIKKIRTYLPNFSKLFFVSKRNYEVALRQIAMPIKSEVHFIQNPCKVKLDFHLEYPKTEKIKLGFVGRLENRNKGLDILIDALSHPLFLDFSWQLEIWGEGPDKDYLVDLMNFHNLSNNIFFRGFSADILDVWSANEMLVLPSYNEGTPLTILEAMMCSRATFTTDVGDNAEYIKHNINGFLIPAGTKGLIVQGLHEAFKNRSNWKEMGQRAFSDVNRKISLNPEQQLFEEIFKS
jgi:glycosyltransferase involved in cell wall biosynthesis